MKHSLLRNVTLIAILAMVFTLVAPVAAGPQASGKPAHSENGIYIVEMAEQPAVAYTGGIKGYAATQPKAGQKINPLDPKVVNYVGYLTTRHDAALKSAGGGKKLYDYGFTFNGFAAKLTNAQVAKMASLPGVVAVSADELHTMDTSSTPAFLGLSASGGLWDQLGGVGKAGEGIIIGDIDSGIWPESASFAPRIDSTGAPSFAPSAKLVFQQIPGWHGKCTPGEAFAASMCNTKLIGAQRFNAAWGGDAGINALRPWEFNSPRDYNGHGTHTASTAGGNNNVSTAGPAAAFGTISGMAPRARIAMYKALWSTQDASTASGFNSDLVAAIDRAVADGVDVINYSISGTNTNFRDPVEISFLNAAAVGIFVSTSAGNSGPTAATVAHPAPWTTTVAAGTHNRSVSGSVTLGDGSEYNGASVAAYEVSAPLIDSVNAGMAGASAKAVSLCYSTAYNGGTPALDPAKVAGKIVVCDRGTNARVDKSLAVKEAGGVGMILVNVIPGSLNADFHSIPTVHLPDTDYAAVHAYAATASPTATIHKASFDYSTPAPFTASFSSRGPLLASGDLLKPDVIAPGQDILASVSPVSSGGLEFNLYSGTSMSAPHVAGVAALLKQAHKDWTPMMIKSALMTTAYDVLDAPGPTDAGVIFSQGAGHIKPNNAVDPGLVYNSGWNDWLAFICATQPQGLEASICTPLWNAGYFKDPSNFNSPSIAIGELIDNQQVSRTVKSVSKVAEAYEFSYTGLDGIGVTPSVSSFTINPGASQTFKVTFKTTSTTVYGSYVGGYILWTSSKHIVRIPVVLNPVALSAPVQVTSDGSAISYDVTFGYSGPFTAAVRGLVPAVKTAGSVSDGQLVDFPLNIPSGTTYARVALFDDHVTPGSDLDLRLYQGNTLVGSSLGPSAAEVINLVNPTAGAYTIEVEGFATSNPTTFTLFTYVLGSADAGNMVVSAPLTATSGETGTINLTFSLALPLAPDEHYLGSVVYGGTSGMPNPTIVNIAP